MPEQPTPEQGSASPFVRIEEEMAAYWKKQRIFERSIEERSEKKGYAFYDGPPFATGLPHYGHLLQSAIKDAVPRYWTMRGYRVPRRWGWDCHGLPVENLIEKELKLATKREIEAFGIDKFNDACQLSVFRYTQEWARYVERLGRWVDFEDSYKTMDNDYIESVWWVFSELYKKELVYKGLRVSLFCPRCSTPLSNFEIAMGNSYADHEDPAIYIKFPVKDKPKTFFLAWTTTPWSLPGNTGLSVNPDLMYLAVKLDATGETLIFAEARQSEVLSQYYPLKSGGVEFEVVDRWKGSELVGMRYEPIFSFLPAGDEAYRVVAGAHVTAEDGTGIVHTAPAFGEDDLKMAKEHGLPIFQTVDDEGKQIDACGPFAGLKTKDSDHPIMQDLEARGLLYRAEKVVHSVPICWRCNTLLLYKAQPAWFVNVTALKPKLLKNAQKIEWHPEHFKDGRFGKGLETAPDWNVSRTRYWGSPMPVWDCTTCDKRKVVSSVAELKKLAKKETLPDPLDLHRPIIDQVVLPCECGGDMRRIPEVFDCWFESGSMPVASQHYPFENKKWFDDNFPADFIAEGQDQTRGWFYVLHVLSTALFNKPSFTNVIVTGLILAEDGRKMSKSLKNYPDPWEILTTYGADALRYYMLTSPVVEAESLLFSERDLQNVMRGFINILWNVKLFYSTYAPEGTTLTKPRSAHVLDRWIFSRYAQLLKEVTEEMDRYELAKAARPIREFVNDLSTWWLRRSRDRLKSQNEYDRNDALRTLREILESTAKLLAPFTPFIADKIYLDIGGMKASVHLETWPKVETRVIDERLTTDMQWVRDVVSKTHEARAQAKIAIRQALGTLTVHFAHAAEADRLRKLADMLALIRDEVNVENIVLDAKPGLEEPWTIELDTVITPELRIKGLRREFARQVMNLRKEAGLQPGDRIRVQFQTDAKELEDAVLTGAEELKRDLKADALDLISATPSSAKATADAKVGGHLCKVFLG